LRDAIIFCDFVLTFRRREMLQRSVATFLNAHMKRRVPAVGCTGGQVCRDTFYDS
jgi:hypothetical protein